MPTVLRLALLLALILPPQFGADGAWVAFAGAAWADDGGDGDGGDGGDGGGEGGGSGGDGGAEPAPLSATLGGSASRNEIVAVRVTPAQLAALAERGFRVLDRRRSELLPTTSVRLRAPLRLTLDQAIAEVERLNPASVADRNHYYRHSSIGCDGPHCDARALVKWPLDAPGAAACRPRGQVTIGLIDTGVQREHPALAGRPIETLAMRSGERRPSDPAHGTAVASLLVGAAGSSAPGLLRDARLVAVDAFHRSLLGDERMDVFDLVAAIDELARRKVRLINFSFAGPPNKVLERSVQAAARRGVVMVAAVGNDGPRAGPRYPAAYPSVIAVTAVDDEAAVYRRAGQGEHVEIAAPGVDVWTARAGTAGGRPQTGTSFAAPFVTAAAALLLARSPGLPAEAVARELRRATRDLGERGVDPVYGHGLLTSDGLCGARPTVRASR